MDWKEKFTMIVGGSLVFILVIYILFNVLESTTHSPTDLMTDPAKNSFFGEVYDDYFYT